MLSAENTVQQISCIDAPVKQDAIPAGGIRVINLDKSQEDCEEESNMTKTSGSQNSKTRQLEPQYHSNQSQKLLYSTRVSKQSQVAAKPKQIIDTPSQNSQTRSILKLLKRSPLQQSASARPLPDSETKSPNQQSQKQISVQSRAPLLRKNTAGSGFMKQLRVSVDKAKRASSVTNNSDTNNSRSNIRPSKE